MNFVLFRGKFLYYLLPLWIINDTHPSDTQSVAEESYKESYIQILSFAQPEKINIINNTPERISLEMDLTSTLHLKAGDKGVEYNLPEGIEIVSIQGPSSRLVSRIKKIKINSLSDCPLTVSLHLRQKVSVEADKSIVVGSFQNSFYFSNVHLEHSNIFLNFFLSSVEISLSADLLPSNYKLLETSYFQELFGSISELRSYSSDVILRAKQLFDGPYYSSTYSIESGIQPFYHYLERGVKSNYKPFEDFDPALYKKYVQDCSQPLLEFLKGPILTPQSEGTEEIIVSLTSWLPRIKFVYLALESLLRQSYPPARIILWLAQEEFPDQKLPKTLEIMKYKGVDVRFSKNIGPAMKLLPTLKEFPESVIVTFDDDIYYDSDCLADLVNSHKQDPASIFSHFTRSLTHYQGNVLPLNQWRRSTHGITDGIVFTEGFTGALYPPHSLHPEVFNIKNLKELAFYGDDIWFFGMALLNNTPRKLSKLRAIRPIDIPGKRQHALLTLNSRGRNDLMIRNVFEKYGIYELLNLNGSV